MPTGGAVANDAEATLIESGRPQIKTPLQVDHLRPSIRQIVGS